jgi:regulator of protease activity HflC (stomatin/prohibitin superfamily)
MILQADARVESARRDAEAQVTLAEASAEAIKRVSQAIGDHDTPMLYLLGEKYITSITKLAASDNAKMVVLPADIQETVRGVLGKFKA